MKYLTIILALFMIISAFYIKEKYNLVTEAEYHNLIQPCPNPDAAKELMERYP